MKTKFLKDANQLPKHIAFIMDGNGRWAKRRLLPRSVGHKFGVKKVLEIVEHAFLLGVNTVSLYAFSTENWKRPDAEKQTLFELLQTYFSTNLQTLIKNNVRIEIMGDITAFPAALQTTINECIAKTAKNTANVLNIGINYGARDEIVRAVNILIANNVKLVDKEQFANHLYTKNLTDPDLIIRTSNEIRLSNFMLYQAAYSELYFTKTLWPDFGKRQLERAIKCYLKRNRRYGGV